MNAAPPPLGRFLKLSVLVSGIVVALWVWHCWCVFPFHSWNELRLQPTFLFAHGQAAYATEANGPWTTWIYGPLPFLIMLPVTLASSASAALLWAGTLNLALVTVPILLCCLKLSTRMPVDFWSRGAVCFACLAFWQASSFQYLQADNLAVACGLVANLLLALSPARRAYLWIAAGCAVAALASKQTAIELAAAQLAWLGITTSWKESAKHAARIAMLGGAAALSAVSLFGWEPLQFCLLVLPSRLPWTDDLSARLGVVWPAMVNHLFWPILLYGLFRRTRWFHSGMLLLPGLCWLFAMPTGLAGLLKFGGTVNSLHGLMYLLPPVLLCCVQRRAPDSQWSWAPITGVIALSFIVSLGRLASQTTFVGRPLTQHLAQADFLARSLPGQVWFPWNPLVTFYSENRFDHTEDGFMIRYLAQKNTGEPAFRAHLPPAWHVTVMRGNEADWGLAENMSPSTKQTTTVGMWRVISWEISPSSKPTFNAAHP